MPIPGISYDGGYQEYMIVPKAALARLPEGISFADAAPLLCAGITTFNALRNSGAGPGDLVAVQGVGGLGHLGIQLQISLGTRWLRSAAEPRTPLLPKSSARIFISIARRSILRRS